MCCFINLHIPKQTQNGFFKVDKIQKILLSLNHCKRPLLMTYYYVFLQLVMMYTVQVKRNYRLRERKGTRSFECHARLSCATTRAINRISCATTCAINRISCARRPARSIKRITRAIRTNSAVSSFSIVL